MSELREKLADYDRVIERGQYGKDRAYKSRADVLEQLLTPDNVVRFRADGDMQRASVRGAAYAYGRRIYRKVCCRFVKPDVVVVFHPDL